MADEKDVTDETKVVTDETNPGAGIEEGIDDLKAKLAAAEARATAAERTAAERATAVDQAQDEVTRSNLTVINGAIEQLNGAKESLKAQYANAMAEGDFAKAADLNLALIENTANLQKLENGKVAIETAPKREALRTARASDDPVERAIGEWKLSPKSADWVRRHPEYATDQRKTQRMLAAHNMVMTDDNPPELESPEYFAAIEKNLGLGYSDQRREPDVPVKLTEEPLSAAAAPARRRDAAPPPAAPSGRGTGNGRVRTLTAAQAEAAKISGLSNEDYAKQLERIARDKPN